MERDRVTHGLLGLELRGSRRHTAGHVGRIRERGARRKNAGTSGASAPAGGGGAAPEMAPSSHERHIATVRIRIFVTGGTFDKEYDELHGSLFFRNTHVPEMLTRGRCALALDVEMLMMLDSLEMAETHRNHIVAACRSCGESQIVITHGTDTMVETAGALAAAGVDGKTIVLTGAMVPYAFGSSDGLFNLGSALSFVQTLAPGVYIAMNGRWFPWDNVEKNREAGVFEPLHR